MVNLFLTMLRHDQRHQTVMDYLDALIVPVADTYLVPEMKSIGENNGYATSFNQLWRVEKTGFLKFDLVNDHHVALYLEEGTKPHVIEGDLHFPVEDGGWVRTKHVDHPGFEGYHVFEKALASGALDRFESQLATETISFLQRTVMK
ncbi:hypothetical protein LCGC14_2139740 [marine sediment metagenome]|uniref:Uncharacterized protein n=1 Tax=marine sediment metagenome TaxID=412755 RepID=A0A0F9DYP6_9ZZZZ